MSEKRCVVTGCEKVCKRRGSGRYRNRYYDRYCPMHRSRMTRHGSTELPPKAEPQCCVVEGCKRTAVSRGWCKLHYERWRKTGSVYLPVRVPQHCAVEGCENLSRSLGLCPMHYHRRYRTGQVGEACRRMREQRGTCTVDGCDKTDNGFSGLCAMHETRLRRTGNVGQAEPYYERIPGRLTYSGAHQRVRAIRGPASHYPCTDCHEPADQWSYDHTDPDELTELRNMFERGLCEVPYSMDPNHYEPRCIPCHRSFDQVLANAC